MRRRLLATVIATAMFGAVLSVAAPVPYAAADGSPNIALAKEMPSEVLLGAPIPATLTLSNPSGPDGFNATFTDTLPAGVTYVGGSSSPEPDVLPQVDGTTVLVWENVADSLTGSTVVLDYSIVTASGYDAGDIVTNSANVYANSDARTLPDVDPVSGLVTGGFTGNAAASDSTTLLPFELTKVEPNRESELLRGVHDHQTVYTLTIDNNFVNPSSDFSIVDYLPAGLEFLGCGAVDNSSAEEYPGSGPLNPGNAPPMANPCLTPSSVTTVNLDPDGAGQLPTAVYTRVEWDTATLATSLVAGGSFSMDYVAGIALQENQVAGLTDVTANLDNNTGSLTTESETPLRNFAITSGTYNTDIAASTDGAYEIVLAEDISIHKSVSSPTFEQGDTPIFTLDVETSEYAVGTGTVTVTDTLPATLDFTGATPGADSAVVQPDGTTLITWTLPGFAGPSSTSTITINTVVREFYRNGDGTDGSPVSANDSYTNTTELASDVTIISDTSGGTTVFSLDDESEAIQESTGPSILKEVSVPISGTLTCGDGAGVSFDPTLAGDYRPGDRVCWRLNVDFPPQLDTLNPVITDFLPDGFVFEGWEAGAGSALANADFTFTDNDPQLSWALNDQDAGGVHVEIVVSTLITDPTAAESSDLVENLMKFRYSNLSGEVFQLRDGADIAYSEALLTLDKGVILLNGVAVAGAPSDNTTVQEGDDVTYQLNVANIGTETALDASIRDVLPEGIVCADVSAISGGGSCDVANNWIQWDAADDIDVAPAASTQLTYVVTVPVGTSAGAALLNTAGVRTYGGETNSGTPITYVPANNIDDTLTPNTDAADDDSEIVTALPTVAKTVATSIDEPGNNVANQATIGETLSYTIDVDMPAGATYYNTTITDIVDDDKDVDESSVAVTLNGSAVLPAGVTVTADNATNTITVDFPSPYNVPVGIDHEYTITFDAVVLDVADNDRTHRSDNTANLDFENAAGDARNAADTANVRIVEPNIVLEKAHDDVDGVVTAGQTLTYTLDVTNDDVSASRVSVAHDTVVIDTIPPQLVVLEGPNDPAEDLDVLPSGGIWLEGPRTITWTILTLNPGATTALTYDVQTQNPLIAAGSVQNIAEATTTSMAGSPSGERSDLSPNGDADGDGYQDGAEATVQAPLFELTKAVAPLIATIGEPATYMIDVTIPGGVVAYDVTVIDELPDGMAFESLTSISCDEGGGACAPDIATADAAVVEGGGDVAFFFDDLTTAAAADRLVTITYVAVVDDVFAADAGATLTNSAAVYWNAADTITTVPLAPPVAGSFDDSSAPDTADIGTREPTLTIDKDVAGQTGDADNRRAVPGDILEYSVTITNTGNSDAFNATITDVPTNDTWAFTDTTAVAGVTNTDADPVGGLVWTIDGPLAPTNSVTITYELVVPLSYDSSNEIAAGPEQSNTADIPSYFGVDEATRLANPLRDYREYDDVTDDTVEIELDLASIGNQLWFDVNNDGVQQPGEPSMANVDVIVTYLGADGVPGGGDDEVFTATTNGLGLYLAENLPGGNYTVDVDETDPDFLTGLVPSYDLDGATVSPNGNWTGPLGEDEDKRDVDFGYTGSGSIGDTIWLDQDLDGVVDANEGRLAGVAVTVTWLGPDGLAGGGDDIAYSATTDATGNYLVEDLPPGEYTVVVDPSTVSTGYSNVSDPGGEGDNASTLTLGIGEDNLDQDFGYAGSGSIGDTIWLDQDNSGTQNGAEPGLGGVMVQLTSFGPDGVLGGSDDSVFTTTTDANGNYLFDALPPGNYEVEITGAVPANVTNSYDPDTAAPGDSISTLTLGDNEDNLDQDFGYSATSVLGDRIWWDVNSDGIQDTGEPGLNGFEVTATYLGPDGILGTVDDETFVTTTSGDGDYLFQNIPDGDYVVAVTSGVPVGLDPTFDEDSGTTSPDETTSVSLVDEHLTADFGYVGTGAIGDTLWFDPNSDGTQDPGEFGFEGVTVYLDWLGPDGVVGGGDDITLSTSTDATGNYLFENLPAGEYVVTVDESTLPAGLAGTYDADDLTTAPDGESALTLGDGEVNLDQDFGYTGSGSIGDTIWLDQDGDGLQGPDEVGIGAVTVTLTWNGPFGPETLTTSTDVNGNYLFDNLPAGDFTVTVDTASLPAGLAVTFDADGAFDDTSNVTLADGEANLDQDFGYQGAADIGDTIWLDLNGDGVIDANEPGVPNQSVELTWQGPAGPITLTTTTDSDGNYLFPGLPDGDYTVTVVGGIVASATNTGDPGDPAGSGDSTNDLTIAGGVDDLDQDFGYQGPNSIGDLVWLDYDQDGSPDSNEPGIEDVEVTLTWFGVDGVSGGDDDVVFPTTLTGPDGNYLFGNLPDGSYSVAVTGGLLAGSDTPTYDDDGGTTSPNSMSVVTDLGVGDPIGVADLDQDFGYVGAGSIGDTIWLNLDGDGTQNGDEPGLEGITVTLVGAGPDGLFGTPDDVTYPSQVTDADGNYLFEDLPPGDYSVTYEIADLDPGITPEVDLDGGDLATAFLTLGPDESNLNVDFGVVGNAAIEGTVFVDLDGDGIQGSDEEPLGGVTLTVTWEGPDGPVVFTVVTDAEGDWQLPAVPPGQYTVVVDTTTVPAEYLATIPATTTVAVPPGGVGVVSNAFVPSSSIGDQIWHDEDRDGTFGSNEDGVSGVTVNLLDEDGNVVATAVTNSSGEYLFDDLLPGTYTVSIDDSTLPTGMSIVSTPTGATGNSASVILLAGDDIETIDFGLDLLSASASPNLAFTGRTVVDTLLLGLLLLLAGLWLSMNSRRRQKGAKLA